MKKNTIFSEVVKCMTSKEGIKIMRDAQAMQVAGSVVGICIRNALYKRSKTKGGWYSRYFDHPFTQKWMKADDKSVIIGAVIATALDTVLLLDRSGVIKLHSVEDPDNEDLDEKEAYEAKLKAAAEKAYKAEMAARTTENVAETVPGRDDIDDDEDEDALY